MGGRYDGPLGPALVVAVTAPAVDGRATEAVLKAVAKAFGLRRRQVALRSGAASRDKLLAVTTPEDLSGLLQHLRDGAAPVPGHPSPDAYET